jgi:hypothetical protein
MTDPHTQMCENAPQHLLVNLPSRDQQLLLAVFEELDELSCQPANGQHEIDNLSRNRATWHRGVFRLARVLHQHDATCVLNRLYPDSAVSAGTGQNDGIGKSIGVLLRKRSKELINGRALEARLIESDRRDRMVRDHKTTIWRDDIDAVVLELRGLVDLSDRHRGPGGKNVGKLASKSRIEMNHHDERRIGLVRQCLKKGLKGLNPPC